MPVALITGASMGLGKALAAALAEQGWDLVIDARHQPALDAVRQSLAEAGGRVVAVPGDVTDPDHRAVLVDAAAELGGIDALVNNASTLGPSPMPPLAAYPAEDLERVFAVNVVAPIALAQLALPLLTERRGTITNITSDASVEPYEGWGGYGSSKAALDHATAILAAEQPDLRVYAADPGDMRTQMHQDAFPGEDISDRPEPASAVPALLRLVRGELPSGRHRAAEIAALDAGVSA
ncbi:MAG: SDR family NAD(P)-dependent oxidoreductase [Propionibacteriales bacterium]|nr:SDR family NAD(P)-dependent oxidoreductase [Propionibacteriales bacterium]